LLGNTFFSEQLLLCCFKRYSIFNLKSEEIGFFFRRFVGRCFPNVCFPGFLTDWWNRTNDRWKSLNQFEVQINIFLNYFNWKILYLISFPWNIFSKEYLRNFNLFFCEFLLAEFTKIFFTILVKKSDQTKVLIVLFSKSSLDHFTIHFGEGSKL